MSPRLEAKLSEVFGAVLSCRMFEDVTNDRTNRLLRGHVARFRNNDFALVFAWEKIELTVSICRNSELGVKDGVPLYWALSFLNKIEPRGWALPTPSPTELATGLNAQYARLANLFAEQSSCERDQLEDWIARQTELIERDMGQQIEQACAPRKPWWKVW